MMRSYNPTARTCTPGGVPVITTGECQGAVQQAMIGGINTSSKRGDNHYGIIVDTVRGEHPELGWLVEDFAEYLGLLSTNPARRDPQITYLEMGKNLGLYLTELAGMCQTQPKAEDLKAAAGSTTPPLNSLDKLRAYLGYRLSGQIPSREYDAIMDGFQEASKHMKTLRMEILKNTYRAIQENKAAARQTAPSIETKVTLKKSLPPATSWTEIKERYLGSERTWEDIRERYLPAASNETEPNTS